MKITCQINSEIEILLTTGDTINGQLLNSSDEEIVVRHSSTGFDPSEISTTDYHINPNMVVMWK